MTYSLLRIPTHNSKAASSLSQNEAAFFFSYKHIDLSYTVPILYKQCMPELPEVETVKTALAPAMQEKTIKNIKINRYDLRFPIPKDFIAHTKTQKVQQLIRRGKYIIIILENTRAMILHLGMSGRIYIFEKKEDYEQQKHDHVLIEMQDGTFIAFNDPRRFGMLLLTENGEEWQNHKLFAKMGAEPLGNEFNGPALREKLKNKKANIKSALLDQRVVSGVGNIYACEALFEARIDPTREARSLSHKETENLSAAIKLVLQKAIKSGGSSLKDYKQTDGSLGYFQTMFKVYDRENAPCPVCTTSIERIVQSARSTFYCPSCQK